MRKALIALILVAVAVISTTRPALAGWGDFFDENGNLRPGVVDLGVQKVPVDWMPDLPDWIPLDASATFHMYALPSGETVLLPSATTLFFMAMNPYQSGLLDSNGHLTSGVGMMVMGYGGLLGRGLEPLEPKKALEAFFMALGIPFTSELADAAIKGQNAWSLLTSSDAQNIFRILLKAMQSDKQAIYLAALLYGNCANSPTGCPPELLALMRPTPQVPGSPSCAAPTITRGAISAKAALVAPAKVLVVGQDPDKRGADLRFELTIGPTIVTYEELEQTGTEQYCDLKGYTTRNCPKGHLKERPIYECVQHTLSYCEPPTWVMAEATLRQSSRDWILGDLQWYYPGAYLHKPDWSWRGGSGGCDGSNTYRWTLNVQKAQIEDPGWYDLKVRGATAGTPVTTGRSFIETGGAFDAWLMMTTVIR